MVLFFFTRGNKGADLKKKILKLSEKSFYSVLFPDLGILF